jgi:hypothetical protein
MSWSNAAFWDLVVVPVIMMASDATWSPEGLAKVFLIRRHEQQARPLEARDVRVGVVVAIVSVIVDTLIANGCDDPMRNPRIIMSSDRRVGDTVARTYEFAGDGAHMKVAPE